MRSWMIIHNYDFYRPLKPAVLLENKGIYVTDQADRRWRSRQRLKYQRAAQGMHLILMFRSPA
jgi:hypothetical protein